MIEKAYVVNLDKRIVLFGYCTQLEIEKPHPRLKRARMAVGWDEETHGNFGLAAIGPQPGSRISPAVEEHQSMLDVQSWTPCSEQAIEAWESEPWS